MQSTTELRKNLKNYLEKIAARVEETMPEIGDFQTFNHYFYVPCETIREFHVYFEVDGLNPDRGRRVFGAACFPDDDKAMSVFLFKGTKREILDYLRKPGVEEEMWKIIEHLDQFAGQRN